jgi:hypothetical protein
MLQSPFEEINRYGDPPKEGGQQNKHRPMENGFQFDVEVYEIATGNKMILSRDKIRQSSMRPEQMSFSMTFKRTPKGKDIYLSIYGGRNFYESTDNKFIFMTDDDKYKVVIVPIFLNLKWAL